VLKALLADEQVSDSERRGHCRTGWETTTPPSRRTRRVTI
jgi:hypothetical protein